MKRKTNLLECKSDLNLTKIETYLTDESILPTQPKLTWNLLKLKSQINQSCYLGNA